MSCQPDGSVVRYASDVATLPAFPEVFRSACQMISFVGLVRLLMKRIHWNRACSVKRWRAVSNCGS